MNLKIVFKILIFSFLLIQSAEALDTTGIEQSGLDWKSLSEIMSTYQADHSEENLKNNIKLFLLSSPIQSLRFSQSQNGCANKDQLQTIVSAPLVDILFDELLLNFPFFKPTKSGCSGFLCSEPIFTIMPNAENILEKQKWEALTKWINQDQSLFVTQVDSPYFLKSRGAFKAYTLVKSLADCRLPKANWGPRADQHAKVWEAVEYTIDPNAGNRHGYTIVTGGRNDIEIIKTLEFVDELKEKKSFK